MTLKRQFFLYLALGIGLVLACEPAEAQDDNDDQAQVVMTQYETELNPRTEPLRRERGASVLAFSIEGPPVDEPIRVETMTFEFSHLNGPALRDGDLSFEVYRDETGDGWFHRPGFTTHVHGEGALTPFPSVSIGRIRPNAPATVTVSLEPRDEESGATALLDPGETLRIGVVLWNDDVRSRPITTGQIECVAIHAVGVFSQNVYPATQGDPAPSAPFPVRGEEPECKAHCEPCEPGSDEAKPFVLCLIPNLSWTDGDELQAQFNNPDECLDQATVKATLVAPEDADFDCTLKACAIEDPVRVQLVGECRTDGNDAEQDIRPLEGSEACNDASITFALDYIANGTRDTARVTCVGTVFQPRVFPVIPRNSPATSQLEDEIRKANQQEIPKSLKPFFDYPEGEEPTQSGPPSMRNPRHAFSNGKPLLPPTRVDPTNGVSGNEIRDMVGATEIENVAAAVCTFSAKVNVCANDRIGGEPPAIFQFTLTPEPVDCGCIEVPTLTVHQFDMIDGVEQGSLAVSASSSLDTGISDLDVKSNTENGDDREVVGTSVDGITHESFIYLRGYFPEEHQDEEGKPVEYENFVLFEVCDRPLAALRVQVLEPLSFTVAFNFFSHDDELNNNRKRQEAVRDFLAKVNLLLHQCCIRVRARDVVGHVIDTSAPGNEELAEEPFVPDDDRFDRLRDNRAFDDEEVLNIFVWPGQFVGGNVLGANHPPPGSADEGENEIVVVSTGNFIGVPSDSQEALLEGMNIAFSVLLTHEIGHALGLRHVNDESRVMRPNLDDGDAANIHGQQMRNPVSQIFTCEECEVMRDNIRGLGESWFFN